MKAANEGLAPSVKVSGERQPPPAEGARPGWLGPLRLPDWMGARVLAAARDLGGRLGPTHRWLLAGVLIGAGPLWLDYRLGWSVNPLVTALLLTPLLLAGAALDSPVRGLGAVAAAFAAHSVVVIALAQADPEGLARVLKEGPSYWERSHAWITTGASREYDVAWWLPAHLQLLAAMVALTYTSLGLLPLWQGLYEVDLMNFYVGRLLAGSESPALSLALGWHPWSLCRAAGYLLLTYEVTSLSLARLAGVRLSSPSARRWRWGVGLAFLMLDAAVKYTCLEGVRQALAGNLR
jgi:hypothetical protein